MAMYAMFYDNIPGSKRRIAVAFDSGRQYENFINHYQNYGEYRRFNSDIYGTNKEDFLSYFHLGPETKIIRLRGKRLFRHLMKVFEGWFEWQ